MLGDRCPRARRVCAGCHGDQGEQLRGLLPVEVRAPNGRRAAPDSSAEKDAARRPVLGEGGGEAPRCRCVTTLAPLPHRELLMGIYEKGRTPRM